MEYSCTSSQTSNPHAYYRAVIEKRKTFEIRDNRCRDFNAGDTVVLKEIYSDEESIPGGYTGRSCRANITYVTTFAQKEHYVVFAIQNVTVIDN